MNEKFFCIYSGKEHDVSERSEEHIVPFSLGGSNQFTTLDVSRKYNNDAGSQIDAKLINNWFVAHERWRLKLKSQNGSIPPILFEGTVDINGKIVKATYSINPDNTLDLVTIPTVNCDWTSGKIQVNCDPKDLPEILSNVEKRAKKKGLKLNQDSIKDISDQIIKIENPEMHAEMIFNLLSTTPAFLKMALATSHKVLGYAWSKGNDASVIRKAMWESNPENYINHKIKGSAWPNCDSRNIKQILNVGKDRHLLAILNLNPVSFYCILFGEFEGMIQIQDGVWQGPELQPGDGKIFIIDCKTRSLEELRFGEFIVKKGQGLY